MSLNSDLSNLFANLAAIMDIRGENPFKSVSFSKISRLLADLPFDIKTAFDKGELEDIEGIGEHSRKIITEYITTGHSSDYDEAITSIPPGLLEVIKIPGTGPKTAALLWKQRGITSIEDLVKAIDEGKLEGLKGIGEKKIEQIKSGIAMRSQAAQRMGIVHALEIGQSLLERLRKVPGVKQAEIAGSLRRWKETVGDVDLICCVEPKKDPAEISAAFVKFPEVEKIQGQGKTKASVITAGGLQVDLRMVPIESFGAALMYFTGSKDHNVRLRGLAQDKGYTLNEWGLYDVKVYDRAKKKTAEAPDVAPLAGKSENEVYHKLGLAYIEPEIRENRGEIEAAAAKKLPHLVTLADIHGDLHSHTTASDGHNTIEEMAEAAKALGYTMLAITDHSKSQAIANGLTAARLLKHVEQIHKVGAKIKGITLLAGCEVDILIDGRLDFEDDVLKELDWIVASPHVSLRQASDVATIRLLRAIDNRYVNVIGHPTGRLINKREGLPLDFAKIFKAAAASGTALEINAGYPRLDLNDVNAHAAIDAGCMLSINTDAHSTGEFDSMILGISVARRAWAEKKNIINCMTAKQLVEWAAKKRG